MGRIGTLTLRAWAAHFVALVIILGAIAAAAPRPEPRLTDEAIFEATAQHFVLPDCSDLQCVRVLAPWIVGRLPGSQLLRWKAYAVVATAAAALALARFALAAGLSARASQLALWLFALGFGPMLTLYNPYSPDPLMYFAAPFIATALWQGKRLTAMVAACIGVVGKEVAAAPLWIFWLWAIVRRQWASSVELFAMAFGATLTWVWVQLWLMIAFNYSYGGSKSVDLLHGSDLVVWWGELGLRGGLVAIFVSFGALWVLMPIGFLRASRDLRLIAICALPAALVLCYLQQPDRALWNFHYAMIPFAVIVLEQLPAVWCWIFVAGYGVANLRIGAQLTVLPEARYGLLLSVAIAAAAIVVWGRRSPAAAPAIANRSLA
jgi:hypothetical protein